jgi:hypothetical protein
MTATNRGGRPVWQTRTQPSGQRVEDVLAWAWEIVNRYDPEGTTR